MYLGYICRQGLGETDRLMGEVAALLRAEGLVLAGALQLNRALPGRARPAMDLLLLPDGPVLPISLDRGPAALGCRLDTSALEEASVVVAERLPAADVLFVNKFGKQEADGHGMAGSVSEALLAGKPVITGLADHFLEGFLRYAGGHARELTGEAGEIAAWLLEGHRAAAAAASAAKAAAF
ncbi:DUF2478 domain-containing protein [Pseudogemmobacter faecipullorum]|uniref:DUF2478 domain-containing protein n=1 Tax=Pseudogemmobacter faecipullorum TaxID=2755041 RepID=A0ABS8CIX4_9RHOB|nr:DUF2478 domain-containing protein [Pseudogemmobacter faecipullorum]MCB5409324.1 DUF2478 domain-containing protein [Pseudogemmobacter faecipullorum]